MLVSKKHKFFFLRVPKTGSTSAVFYFLDSGLIEDDDIYGNKTAQKLKRLTAQVSPEMGNRVVKDEIAMSRYAHQKYTNIIADRPFLSEYASIATVRNPVDRMVSAALMLSPNADEIELNGNIELLLSSNGALSIPQHEFIGENTLLWPTENLTSLIESFILSKGGTVRGEWRCRANGSENRRSMVSQENTNKIMDKYAKDFELWEKAYAA